MRFNGMSTVPETMGSYGDSRNYRVTISGSTKVYLRDGYEWCGWSVYSGCDGGGNGGAYAYVDVYFKDGTSQRMGGGYDVRSSGYFQNRLTTEQIANIDYVLCSGTIINTWNGRDTNGHTCWTQSYATALKKPWVSD